MDLGEAKRLPSLCFEIQISDHGVWVIRETGIDRRDLGRAINQYAATEGSAVRAVRCTADIFTDHLNKTVVHQWNNNDPDVPDQFMPAVEKLEDVLWTDSASLYSEIAQFQLRRAFAQFLKSRFLTVRELLHDPRPGAELSEAWQMLQGGVQPIALQQAMILEMAGPEHVKALTELLYKTFKGLIDEAKTSPPIPAKPGHLSDLVKTAEDRFPLERRAYEIARSIAATVKSHANWPVRLHQFAAFCQNVHDPETASHVDRYFADFILSRGSIEDICKTGKDLQSRLDALTTIANGRLKAPKSEEVPAFEAMNEMILAGYLPRMQSAVRARILEEIGREFAQPHTLDLLVEISDMDRQQSRLEEALPMFQGDPEFQQEWNERIRRRLTRDQVNKVLMHYRQPTERLSTVASMFAMLRGIGNRDHFGTLVTELLSLPEISRELEAEMGERSKTLQPLLKFHQRINAVQFHGTQKEPFLAELDAIICRIMQADILEDPRRKPMDRIMQILRHWMPAPMPEGESRDLVEKVLRQAMQRPDFFNHFFDSFKNDRVRAQAAATLQKLVDEYGLRTEFEKAMAASDVTL